MLRHPSSLASDFFDLAQAGTRTTALQFAIALCAFQLSAEPNKACERLARRQLPIYKFYPVNDDGREGIPLIHRATNDEQAMLKGLELANGQILEIWEGNRRVGTVNQKA